MCALVGLSFLSASSHEKVYIRMGEQRLQPATNMKLVTGAAALAVLGEDHRFSTEVWTDGIIVDHDVSGHLYMKGKEDPTVRYQDIQKINNDRKWLWNTQTQEKI